MVTEAISRTVANSDLSPIPVARYVRMSTEHQRYSTENQGAAIQEYADAHGMQIVYTYSDAGKSGLNIRGRLGLQQLLFDVQKPDPGFQAVLVYDVSRWGRFPDPDEAGEYERICKRRGIKVIYCAEPFVNDGSMSATVMVGLKRSMAAEYSRELSVKVFAGHRTLVQLGYRQGGSPGYGLRRQLVDEKHTPKAILSRGERKSIQTDRVLLVAGPDEEIATVREIYRMFLDLSMPERVIASTLNRQSIKTDLGTSWTKGTVHQVLTNEKYIGNNVYNRTSFKLKVRHEKNAPVDWIRKDGAFPAIVTPDAFARVANIIRGRSVYLDDAQILGLLKVTLERRGTLSGIIIDEEDGVPSSSIYRSRFGSLLQAYSLIGFSPERDYSYLELNKNIRQMYPGLVDEMAMGIRGQGGWSIQDANTDLLTINDEFTVSLVIAKCKTLKSGSFRWNIPFDASLEPDFSVVARLDVENRKALDYYVFPSIDFARDVAPSKEDNDFALDVYRMSSLNYFYFISGRASLREAV